jgi:GNAT superfamily N-acetyltransferase
MSKPTGFAIELFTTASVPENRERICQLLYAEMARSWIDRGRHTHQLSYFATDDVLTRAYYRLGFGMTHFQLFRDLGDLEGEIPELEIRYAESESQVRELDGEHLTYYPNPPLFWIPDDLVGNESRDPIVSDHDRVAAGEMEIVMALDDGEPVGYFKLLAGTAESILFEDLGNCQIKSAYLRPSYRKRGFGRALLAETLRRARHNGLKRLYVEGESANTYGGNFWFRHFRPAEYSIRRCVDERINASLYSET